MFYQIPILSSSGAPKKFQVLARVGFGSENLEALIAELNPGMNKTYQLGKDALPEGMEDIRALLNPQPTLVFAWFDTTKQVNYFGIEEGR